MSRVLTHWRLLIVAGTIGVFGFALILLVAGPREEYSRSFWPVWKWFKKVENADGTIVIRSHLNRMAADILKYFEACDSAEWNALCKLHSPREVLASLERKVEMSIDKDIDLVALPFLGAASWEFEGFRAGRTVL